MDSCDAQRRQSSETSEAEQNGSYRTIAYTSISSALSDLSQSMLIAFFPNEAKKRGLSIIEIGVLFATFHLFALVTCLSTPRLAASMNSKLTLPMVLKYGMFIQALIGYGFSFTGQLSTPGAFFATFFCLRSFQGILSGLCEVSSIGLVKRSVPAEMVSDSMVWIESARTLGVMIGPLIGGGLNILGGYMAPYLFSASSLLAISFIMIIFPVSKIGDPINEGTPDWNVVRKLFKSPVVCAVFLSIVSAAAGITFLEPTILPFLSNGPYLLDQIEVGLLYLTLILVYGIMAGFSGLISSYIGSLPAFCLGMLNLGIGYCVIAPSTNFEGPLSLFFFLHGTTRSTNIFIAFLGLYLMGFGAGTCLVPMNSMLVKESIYKGITPGLSAVTISSIINVGFTSGGALGPIIGGALAQKFDFQRATVFFGYCILGCTLISTIIAVISQCGRSDDDGSTVQETIAESLLTTQDSDDRRRGPYMESEPLTNL